MQRITSMLCERFAGTLAFLRFAEFPLPGLVGIGMVSLIAAVLDGLGIGLLVPLLNGVIENDLTPVTDSLPFIWFTTIFTGEQWHRPAAILAALTLLACGAAITHQVFEYWASIKTSRLTRASADKLRRRIFDRHLNMGQAFFDRRNFGELQTLIIDYSQDIGETGMYLRDVVTRGMVALVYFILMLVLSWQLTLILVVLAPIYHFGVAILIRRIRAESPGYSEAKSRLNSVVHRVLPRLPLVRSSSMLAKESRIFADRSNDLRCRENQMDDKIQLIVPLQRVFLCLLLLLLLFLIYGMMQRNWIGISGVLVYFFMLREIVNSMGMLSFFRANISRVQGHITAIKEMEKAQPKFAVTGGSTPFDGLREGIHFRNLEFKYEDHPTVLAGMNFSIPRGKSTALVGASGAGKSTLIQLLLRHYPCPNGSIFFDDIDINNLEVSSLAAGISWVSQNVQLFNDTLRNNLTYGRPEPADELLQELLTKTHLTEVVSRLPNGLETQIGDDGVRLSGGERQRVSLARALLKDASILILDEATNAMDWRLESEISETMNSLVKERTVIIIAHRLDSIQNVDHVVFIEKGRVLEQGRPTELLNREGPFKDHWRSRSSK